MPCLVGPRLLPGGNDIVSPQGGSKTSNMGFLEKAFRGLDNKEMKLLMHNRPGKIHPLPLWRA